MDKKTIVGLSVRTTNAPGKAEMDIPKLWERFYQEGIPSQIPHTIGDEIIALYTDYAGDHTQPYTVIIGMEVSNLDNLPDGLVGKEVPAATYVTYDVDGPFPQSLIEAWQKVWEGPIDQRTFVADMEIYPKDFDPVSNPKHQLLIGVHSHD